MARGGNLQKISIKTFFYELKEKEIRNFIGGLEKKKWKYSEW